LIELVMHVLDATGPADVTISTWTAAGADLAHTRTLIDDGRIRSARWLVDFSFPSRQPAYVEILREQFGDESIRCTANHAKFVMVRNEAWNVVIRTSMNLNLNRRLESYEVSDDADLADWLEVVVADAFGGGASTIAEAIASPGKAQQSTQTLAGEVARREPQLSYGGGRGISHD
jgi:hypothetical protein